MELNLDDLKRVDLQDFVELQCIHRQDFVSWCEAHCYSGIDDELDNDLDFLVKAFEFFNNRGYIKKK